MYGRELAAAKISAKRRNQNVLAIGHQSYDLTIISEPIFLLRNAGKGNVKVRRFYNCRCVCGTEKIIDAYALQNGITKSCGCKWKERIAQGRFKHGGHRGKNNGGQEKLYSRWSNMKERCNNSNNKRFKDYGGRGIKVCPEWENDYAAFREWALSHGYQDYLEIDRKDNDGSYCPENCHFVTHKQNSMNSRRTRTLTAFGETKAVKDWLQDPRCKTEYKTIINRVDSYNWEPEKAITTPTKRSTRKVFNYEPEYYI